MRCPKSFLRGLSLLKDDLNETRRSCGVADEPPGGGERGRREWLRKTNFSNGSGNGNVNKTPSTVGRAGLGRAG